ncbi:MAG: STM4015 family protein [bacterium]|nr:STM4015 family protein [bacterium]
MQKKYSYSWKEEDEGKGAKDLLEEIVNDVQRETVDELVIGNWGEAYEGGGSRILVDGIVEEAEKFQHLKSLFVGDMDYEECEVSWIIQTDYSRLWKALPKLKALCIKGSQDLKLGKMEHENLEELTIICGGLPSTVIEEIQKAKLPSLKKLQLYLGVEDYGFDGGRESIQKLLKEADFPKLTYLGLVDSEMQDEVAELVLESKFMPQLEVLDLSMGTLSDKGGACLLEKLPKFLKLRKLDVHYHYLSDEMEAKLEALSLEVDVSEQQEAEEWNGELWMNAMLTE